ncbi:MAG: glycosyltransferase family 39 protein [Anaerolineae bacterium]|nr:MAG: glycosyltransferase family 39 protein [Anaerolineae bacterium]
MQTETQNNKIKTSPHASRTGITLILILYLILALTYSVVTPLFEASDELWHYPMVKHIADHWALPEQDPEATDAEQPWRQEGSQPPLYYALGAALTFWIDTDDMPQVRWLNPHADNGIITPDGNVNLAIHTDREMFPWRGTALAVHLVRFASVLMGAGTVLFTYLIARQVLPGRKDIAVGAAALNAFLPMFLFISGAVNNDNLTWLLCSASLWQLLRMVNDPVKDPEKAHWPRPLDRRSLVLLGLTLAAGVLTKESALGLLPLTGLAISSVAWRRRSWRYFIEGGLITAGLVAAIAGWWYWRNLRLYGDWLGMDMFYQVLGTRANPASLRQLWGERFGFAMAGWGLFGGINVSMDGWTYDLLNWVAVISIAGLLLAALRTTHRAIRNTHHASRTTPWAIFLLWPLIVLISWSQWARVTWSSQGRLVFSALSAFCVLMFHGLSQFVPRRATLWLGVILAGFLLVVAAAAPFAYIAPSYARPATLTDAEIAAISHRLDLTFGDRIRLLGYDLEATETRPGGTLHLTLYWQSIASMDRNWSVFVHLLDENDAIVAQRDMYPGQGLYPTSLWPVGETIANRYVLHLAETAYAPSAARLEVGLYDYLAPKQERLPASAGGDNVRFGQIAVAPNPGDVPNPVRFNFGDRIALVGYEMDRRAVRAGETLTLTLYWEGLAKMDENYSVFTHVRGEGTQLWAQKDAWPLEGDAPTAAWQVGQHVVDPYPLTLHPATPPGVYDVEIGIYLAGTGERLRLITPDGRLVVDYLLLSKVRVLP